MPLKTQAHKSTVIPAQDDFALLTQNIFNKAGTDTPSPLGGSSVTPEGPVLKEAWVNSEEP